MATSEGEQKDTIPVQLYGWNYETNTPVKMAVNSTGELEAA
jgi:hypothetical protein